MQPSPLPGGAGPNAPATAKYRESERKEIRYPSQVDGQPDDDHLTGARPTSRRALPATQVSLSRVGVTGVEKVIRVKADGGENLYHADFECFVDLNPRQAGVHMSRFEEIVGEAIDEVVLGEAFQAEILAAHIAQRVRERQGGLRAEVSVDGALSRDGDDPRQRASRPRRSTSSSAPRSPPSRARGR